MLVAETDGIETTNSASACKKKVSRKMLWTILTKLLGSLKDHRKPCRMQSAKSVLEISVGCSFKTVKEAVLVYQPKPIPIMNNELQKNQHLRYTPSSHPPVLHRQAGTLARGGISLGPLHPGTKINNGIVDGKTYMVINARGDPSNYINCKE